MVKHGKTYVGLENRLYNIDDFIIFHSSFQLSMMANRSNIGAEDVFFLFERDGWVFGFLFSPQKSLKSVVLIRENR